MRKGMPLVSIVWIISTIALVPPGDACAASTGALRHYNTGKILLEQGRQEEAIEQFKIAADLDPNFVLPRNELGTVYLSQGKEDDAIREFEAAAAIDGRSAMIYNNLGTVLLRKGRTEEALNAFRKALEIEPDNPLFKQNYDKANEQSKKSDKK